MKYSLLWGILLLVGCRERGTQADYKAHPEDYSSHEEDVGELLIGDGRLLLNGKDTTDAKFTFGQEVTISGQIGAERKGYRHLIMKGLVIAKGVRNDDGTPILQSVHSGFVKTDNKGRFEYVFPLNSHGPLKIAIQLIGANGKEQTVLASSSVQILPDE